MSIRKEVGTISVAMVTGRNFSCQFPGADWRPPGITGAVEMEPLAAGTTSGGRKKFTVKTQDEDDNVALAQLLFKPSCTSSPSPAPEPPAGPEGATYADYIVGQATDSLVPLAKPAAAVTVAVTRLQSSQAMQTNSKDKELPLNLAPKPGAKHNSIIVSPRQTLPALPFYPQRGNPILKFICNVPWEFGEIVPDYVLGQSTCALFLSLRYHHLKPNYIHERLQSLGKTYMLQVLLIQVDVKDPHQALKELAKICILADCTLVLAWSAEEAGRYLETYKAYEQKPADLLKEKVDQNYLSRVTDCLTSVKSVNKTDTLTLLSTFAVLELSLVCGGKGHQGAADSRDPSWGFQVPGQFR
ncbi:DNA excision repair protein ERCC-1 isoform X3 [Sphaerodactylus townsendi]|uniref:DNA excision repair protein ERCC-1 isoform X3 n=1 Tax=Sphaerodactylus townsendi TaxID=933632 RepID=UPI002025FB2E|nr:DNA excision repair protein ERCC-1 isoform X3 [Sphaerodactylus townsendi]